MEVDWAKPMASWPLQTGTPAQKKMLAMKAIR